MTRRHLGFTLLATALLGGCADGNDAAGPIQVSEAWIRQPVPPLDKTAGYFVLSNNSDRVVRLVTANSPEARKIEFHETIEDGEMMRMRRLRDVVVEPGNSVRFVPGGKHLMVFGFTATNSPVQVTFHDENGAVLTVPFELR